MPADPTLKLSDLAGPDAAGWADVAVFVRADGDGDAFVVLRQNPVFETTRIHKVTDVSPYWTDWEGKAVRRLGRGRLEPARIVMEGEADLAEQVATLREALAAAKCFGSQGTTDDGISVDYLIEKALAATAPTPTEERK